MQLYDYGIVGFRIIAVELKRPVLSPEESMWLVVLNLPNSQRRTLDKFGQRGEAEAYKQTFVRLVGATFQCVVVFDEQCQAQDF